MFSRSLRTKVTQNDVLEGRKQVPLVQPLLAGGQVAGYLAHAIPEGGYRAMPRLYGDGALIAGDAALMVNGLDREGSKLAMTAGRVAAETAGEEKSRGDFSAASLASYLGRLEASW